MDRTKITEAILKREGELSSYPELRQTLKYFSDNNLLALAIDLGIDTDAILSKEARS